LELFVNFINFHFCVDFIGDVGIVLKIIGGTVVEVHVRLQLLFLVDFIVVHSVARVVELLRKGEGTAQLRNF
jgi:hypothetical protein